MASGLRTRFAKRRGNWQTMVFGTIGVFLALWVVKVVFS